MNEHERNWRIEYNKEYTKRPEVKAYKRWHDKSPRGRFSAHKSRAKRFNRSFTITFEQFKIVLSKPCFVSGCSRPVTGLDRINNAGGYDADNVRPSCFEHNQMKSNRTDHDQYRLAKEFVNWYEKLYQ